MKNAMERTTRIARQIQVHFFIFASMDFPLFLPKKVSLEPPSASIPEELLGCNKMSTIIASAASAISTIKMILSVRYTYNNAPLVGTNKFIKFNIVLFLFFVLAVKNRPFHKITYQL